MRSKALKGLKQHCEGSMFDRCGDCPYYEQICESGEFYDVGRGFICRDELLRDAYEELKESVSQEVVDQIKWERDLAISQLADIGKGLGENMLDIVALLKKKEAHLMTLDEVHNMDVADTCYLEWFIDDEDGQRKGLEIGVVDPEDIIHFNGTYDYINHVKVAWTKEYKERYWSAKPTKEQMESTPWEKPEEIE